MNSTTTLHQSAVAFRPLPSPPLWGVGRRPADDRCVSLEPGTSAAAVNDDGGRPPSAGDVDAGAPPPGRRRRLRRRGRRGGRKVKIFRGANHLANSKGSAYYQQSSSGIGTQSCRVGCHTSSRTYDRAHLLAVARSDRWRHDQ